MSTSAELTALKRHSYDVHSSSEKCLSFMALKVSVSDSVSA